MADTKTEPRTIDITPTWAGILPGLLAVIANGETVEARKAAEQELRRMASLADRYVETMATHVPVRRFGGDNVPEREAAALAEQRAIDGPAPATEREDTLRYWADRLSHTFANGVNCYDPGRIVWVNDEDCLHA